LPGCNKKLKKLLAIKQFINLKLCHFHENGTERQDSRFAMRKQPKGVATRMTIYGVLSLK